jgi:hypothetical protein
MSDRKERQELRIMQTEDYGLPAGPISDVKKITAALQHCEAHGLIVLGNVSTLDRLPPNYVIGFRVVRLPAVFTPQQWNDKSNGLWYRTDGDKLALHRSALERLASGAGISTVSSTVTELVPNKYRAVVRVRYRTIDGQTLEIERSKVVDASEDAARLNGWDSRRARREREFAAEKAETKASSRAIRAALGLPSAFPREVAGAEFVIPALQYVPDLEDPEIRRMVAAREMGIVDQLFGPGARTAAEEPQTVTTRVDVDHDALEVGDSEPRAPRRQAGPPPRQLPDGQAARDAEPGWWSDADQAERQRAKPERAREFVEEPRHTRQAGPPPCAACGVELSASQASYTDETYGRPLCPDHLPARNSR